MPMRWPLWDSLCCLMLGVGDLDLGSWIASDELLVRRRDGDGAVCRSSMILLPKTAIREDGLTCAVS